MTVSTALHAAGASRASRAATDPRASRETPMQEIVALARAFAAAREATEALAEDIGAVQRKALSGRLRALRSRVAALLEDAAPAGAA